MAKYPSSCSPSETLTLRVFDTDYTITLVDAYQAGTVTAGFQKRLDTLGYMTGYLLTPRAPPSRTTARMVSAPARLF